MAIRHALAASVPQLTVLDDLKPIRHPAHAALRILLGGKPARYPLWTSKPALREFARLTAEAIRTHRPQAVFSIASQCLIYLPEFYGPAHGDPPIPTFLFSDSPWMAWLELYRGYYPIPFGAPRFAARERIAARHATGLIYGSEWAKGDAVRRFDVPPDKVFVQPMGASWVPEQPDAATNPEIEVAIEAAIEAAVRNRNPQTTGGCLELLFLAKEWERKGGPLALAITRGLAQRLAANAASGAAPAFTSVRLTIVGVRPELTPADQPLVRTFGMLKRSDPGEAAILRELLLTSHFLVVPTVAECFGLVFAEAQAFALPPVSRAVDAVPSIILDGETGILQPASDGPEPYITRILALLSGDRSAYTRMALSGRQHFRERLNWASFGRGITRIIEANL